MKNNNQTNGAELISRERNEQIHKHGFSAENDTHYYGNGELIEAALFCADPDQFPFPEHWNPIYAEKIKAKNELDRVKIMGAFCAAEIDRLISLGMKSED